MMNGPLTIPSVDVHAEGEPSRVLLGGRLQVRGDTMSERLAWCTDNLDDLRLLLLREPRGHPAMCGVLAMPPLSDDADVAAVILEQGGFRPMSGSNTMCLVTALLETGTVPVHEPETVVRIDTAAGRVQATARVEGTKVRDVQVRNVASWAQELDTTVQVHEYGVVQVDLAFGGQFFVQAPAASLGVQLGPDNAPALVRAGTALLAAAREQLDARHPLDDSLNHIALVMLHGPSTSEGISARNSVILPTGALDASRPETWRGTVDRSPCGTGTCARMACLHARGDLDLGVEFVHQGIMGTTFSGVLHEQVRVGGVDAVAPSIRGRGWITGLNQHVLHPDDPFPRGYAVGDVWAESSF